MNRRQLDDDMIETCIGVDRADASAPLRKRLLKNLMTEAAELGLTIYGLIHRQDEISLDISIGDSRENNAPGELSLSITNDCVKIEDLTINKFSVFNCGISDSFVHCSQYCMKKFGWHNYSYSNYCSPSGVFDFKLSMLANWLKKLNATADAIAHTKKQIEKTRKIVEIQADRLHSALEVLSSSFEAKLPELKCKFQWFPEQKSFGFWLYNVEIPVMTSFPVRHSLKYIFKPAEEYTKFSPADMICYNLTRKQLDEQNPKPVRMFTSEKCIKPNVVAQNKFFEYVIYFVYDEAKSNWRCTAPTVLPNFKLKANLQPDQIENWAESLIAAEMKGYEALKDYEDRMKLMTGETYGQWLDAG